MQLFGCAFSSCRKPQSLVWLVSVRLAGPLEGRVLIDRQQRHGQVGEFALAGHQRGIGAVPCRLGATSAPPGGVTVGSLLALLSRLVPGDVSRCWSFRVCVALPARHYHQLRALVRLCA
jgi:hypothetical protein